MSDKKPWGGRFQKASAMDDFHSSIHIDQRMAYEDITGSLAHARMLAKARIISNEDKDAIVSGLNSILSDLNEGKLTFSSSMEDIHMNIEHLLTERIGEPGKKLHTARSRNDQVALDTRMYMKHSIDETRLNLKSLMNALLDCARQHLDTIMPGYTHLQKAQPITLAHHVMAYFEMFKRDMSRLDDCRRRTDEMPLGSGALATSTYPLDRLAVCDELGFAGITKNSLDAVSDRDFLIEFTSCSSIIMMHLSRFCEELILWSSDEFKFIEMDDAYSTGSSIMPQKKNPDAAELIRGKASRVYGDLVCLLSLMKNLPLAYNKDMQEDKEAAFDALDTVNNCLAMFTEMFTTIKFKADNMKKSAALGFTNATDAADYLTKKGIPFRTAHEIIGKLVYTCLNAGKSIEEVSLDELQKISSAFENDIYEAISLEACVNGRNIPGGPSPKAVAEHIEQGSLWLIMQN